MKNLFALVVIAFMFTNCTKTENTPASDLYVGNYIVNETRTYTDPSTSQPVISTEQFSITISKVDDTTVEMTGFSNCTSHTSTANASESSLVIINPPSYVCGSVGTDSAPASIIISKTNDGFSFTYDSSHSLSQGGYALTSTSGTATKS
ncbi:MAG: hypothetical protein ACI8WT_005027 [Clostridium sp.]|jgi:hypothetical protein